MAIKDKLFLDTLSNYISNQRISHSERVTEVALELNRIHGGDRDCIYKAAALHDIAKNQTPDSIKGMGIQITSELERSWKEFSAKGIGRIRVFHVAIHHFLSRINCGNSKSSVVTIFDSQAI